MQIPAFLSRLLPHAAIDPVTGDKLTASEQVSWTIQRIIRRWAFLGVLQLLTVICWIWGLYNPNVLVWWNLSASDFAIIMEFLIGVAMLGQTLRDALVSRTVLKMEREHGAMLVEMRDGMRRLEQKVDALSATRES